MRDMRAWLRSTQGLIAALAGLLVVTASLVNAGRDLYVVVSGAPRTPDEATNAELFKKHFRETAVLTQPFSAELEGLIVKIELDVYHDGDVFLTVGQNARWFPFFLRKQAWWTPVTAAEAADASAGRYIQTNQEVGGNIVRERIYENGYRESLFIDRNTGQITRRLTHTRPLSPEERIEIERAVPARPTINLKLK